MDLRRPSLSGTLTVTFCSVHIHNVAAKERDASASFLQALHAHMLQHNVDFVGADLTMSAYSTVGHVFAGLEFAAPGSSLLWGLGALTDTEQEGTGFLIIPERPFEHTLASDLVITQCTSLSFFICVQPTSPAPARSCAALEPNTDAWNVQLVNKNARSAANSPHAVQNLQSPVLALGYTLVLRAWLLLTWQARLYAQQPAPPPLCR